VKNIRPKTVDFRNLKLSPEEGFVLSRVDGSTTVKDLVALTGFDETRVVEIVDRLANEGALDVDREPVNVHVPVDDSAEEEPAEDPEEPSDPDTPEEAEAVATEQRNERAYRQIYETVYHPIDKDRRMKAASEVSGTDLLALCFDADPQIIHAILANPHSSVEHARMVALHHRTQIGLEAIAKRAEHLKDSLVQRRLLRNPQLPATMLQRMLGTKLMMEIYKLAIDREIPERSRILTREILRKKFTVASADEKAALLVRTEARCLQYLVNCSLDAHATQILCGKMSYTNLFVQNCARWSATPPALLAHLAKLPVVKHNLGLRKMLLKHPNMPGDVKRGT
jgi:hypothetical protein